MVLRTLLCGDVAAQYGAADCGRMLLCDMVLRTLLEENVAAPFGPSPCCFVWFCVKERNNDGMAAKTVSPRDQP